MTEDGPTEHERRHARKLVASLNAIIARCAEWAKLPPCSNCRATGYGETTELCQVCGGTGRAEE